MTPATHGQHPDRNHDTVRIYFSLLPGSLLLDRASPAEVLRNAHTTPSARWASLIDFCCT